MLPFFNRTYGMSVGRHNLVIGIVPFPFCTRISCLQARPRVIVKFSFKCLKILLSVMCHTVDFSSSQLIAWQLKSLNIDTLNNVTSYDLTLETECLFLKDYGFCIKCPWSFSRNVFFILREDFFHIHVHIIQQFKSDKHRYLLIHFLKP